MRFDSKFYIFLRIKLNNFEIFRVYVIEIVKNCNEKKILLVFS